MFRLIQAHQPRRARMYYRRATILSTSASFLIISLLSGCAKHNMHNAVPETSVDAVSLTKAYADNGVRADEDYKGRIIEVTGAIDNVDNVLGEPTVTLKGDGGGRVQCGLSDAESVSGLSPGQTVKIKGRCSGDVIWVGMNDCVLD